MYSEKETNEVGKTSPQETDNKMIASVDAALEKARKAGAEYEVAALRIERTVSRTTINLSSQSSLNSLRSIVKDCASACDKLYLTYQNLIPALDSELREYLAHKPGAYAVRSVAGTIAWLNEESRIQNNYAAQFDGIDLGQLVRKEYLPRPENLEIERFWKAQYNELPEKGNADSVWTEKLREHKRLAAEEEHKARANELESQQEVRNIMRSIALHEKEEVNRELEKKKKEFQSRYSTICERMEYCRPAAALLHYNTYCYGYVKENGEPRIEYDESRRGCNIRKMHDLKQIICLDGGVVGLGKDGKCQLSNFWPDDLKKYGLEACMKWKNVKKLAACADSNQVIGLLEDGSCVATKPSYNIGVDGARYWTDIVDVVCEQYYAAGLRKDGTVVISGTGSVADNLRMKVSGWRDVMAIFPYDTWTIAALKKDGTLLPDTEQLKEPATAAENIIAIAKEESKGPVFLQANGTVIATRSIFGSWGGKKTEGYPVSELNNVVAIYKGKYGKIAALCEDGLIKIFRHGDRVYALNEGDPIFKSYKEYSQKILKKEKEEQERVEKQRQEERLRAERRANFLCQSCGGRLEKKLFGWKCASCGQRKDY